jgi:hypothetical protein
MVWSTRFYSLPSGKCCDTGLANYLPIDWLTPPNRVLLETLRAPQPVTKLLEFYEMLRFITAFTRARQTYPKPDQVNVLRSHVLKINFNIILSHVFQVIFFSQTSPPKPRIHVPNFMFHFPLLTSYQRISPSPRLCEMTRYKASFYMTSCADLVQPPSWRTTPVTCPQLLIQYIHSYLTRLEAVSPPATWRRAMPWWQEPTNHGVLR